jgi:hypothetical protein
VKRDPTLLQLTKTGPRLNTLASYAFRFLLTLTLASFGLLYKMPPRNSSSDSMFSLVFNIMIGLTGILLVLDWVTKKDPSRKFSKLVDTVLGIGLLLAIGAMVIYSLSMGTI